MNKKIRIIYDVNYDRYLGTTCKCGYQYDEGNYELKGRKNDFVKYNCESCGDSFIVILNKEFKDIESILDRYK